MDIDKANLDSQSFLSIFDKNHDWVLAKVEYGQNVSSADATPAVQPAAPVAPVTVSTSPVEAGGGGSGGLGLGVAIGCVGSFFIGMGLVYMWKKKNNLQSS